MKKAGFYTETFPVSCGLNLSQNRPRIIASNAQNMLMVNALAILKPITKSIGVVMRQGLVALSNMLQS
jgi:hypothetical protein